MSCQQLKLFSVFLSDSDSVKPLSEGANFVAEYHAGRGWGI